MCTSAPSSQFGCAGVPDGAGTPTHGVAAGAPRAAGVDATRPLNLDAWEGDNRWPWDITTGDWKVFFLFTCRRYALQNWNGYGYYVDLQTDNVTSSFYDQYGRVIRSFTPTDRELHVQDWTPVWSIRNC